MWNLTKDKLVDELVLNKVYLWTPRSVFFPKVTESSVLWTINKQIVLNPEIIAEKLISAKSKIDEYKSNKKNILVVLDKEVFSDDVESICSNSWALFLNNKVPSWIFTNFETFVSRIQSMNKLKKIVSSDSFDRLTKKEQLIFKRNLWKLEEIYKWVTDLKKVPDLVVVVDAEYNSWVIDELEKAKIDYIAISNTDLSRYLSIDNLIVANTNSYESVLYILKYLLK